MRIRFSKEVEGQLKELKAKDPKGFQQVKKQLALFETDPKHPSLRIHKLSGKFLECGACQLGLS